jgi:hypothetical protein
MDTAASSPTNLPPGVAAIPANTDPALAERFISQHPQAHQEALRSRFAADRAAPPAPVAPSTVPHMRPLEVIGPAGLPLAPDAPISVLSGSASASAEAMGELIARGLQHAPQDPLFAEPNGNYELAFGSGDPAEVNAQFHKMGLPAASGKAMSGALADSAAEVSASPAFQQYQQARDDHALGRIDDAELSSRSSAWSHYVAEQRKIVSNTLHKDYGEVAKVAALAAERLDKSVAAKWARAGAFEAAGTVVQLYNTGLLIQARNKR